MSLLAKGVSRDMNINAQPLRLHHARSNKSGFLAATLGALTFAAATCSGLTPTQDNTGSIWPTNGWQTSTPEEQGIDSKELAKVVDFGASRILASTGANPTSRLDSLLIVRHGKIVADVYYAPYGAGILHQVNSVTKAITSTLIGIACKDGLLDSPNHKVLEFFDRHEIANLDDRKEAITIQNLLDMTSGIGWSELGFEGTPNSSVSELSRTADWIRFILNRPMWSAPGLDFSYNSGNQHLLSAILTKVSGMSTLEYAKAKLFGPLGITDFYWWHDPQGITDGGFGLFLQPRDMAKIGYLYLHNGEWEGKQLLLRAWIEKVNHATIEMYLEQGLRYSNCFWALPEKHVYMAVGYCGQVIMVFPELDVAAVATGRANFSMNEFADLVSHSVKRDTSFPADPTSVRLLAEKVGEASTEKVAEVSPPSNTAAIISGKIYHFPPNEINVKSLSLFLAGPDQRYEIEAYGNGTDSTSRLTGPTGLDGFYRKGLLTEQGANNPVFSGPPRVRAINAVKGTWADATTFVVDWRVLGIANSPEQRWTLSFNGNRLNVRAQLGGRPEISVDGQTGG
jgi:CubicO group peptidase (beta-lactamase class C family)